MRHLQLNSHRSPRADGIYLEKEYRLKREESQAQNSRNWQLNEKQTEKSEPLKKRGEIWPEGEPEAMGGKVSKK